MSEAMMPQLRSDRRGPAAWLAAPNVAEVKAPTAVAEERAPGTEARVQPCDPLPGTQRAGSSAGTGSYLSSHML
jgi:hypothetical protein